MSADVVHRKQPEALLSTSLTPPPTSPAGTPPDVLRGGKERRSSCDVGRIVFAMLMVWFVCLLVQMAFFSFGGTQDDLASSPPRGPSRSHGGRRSGTLTVGNATATGSEAPHVQRGLAPHRSDIMKVATPFKDLCEWVTARRGSGAAAAAEEALRHPEIRAHVEEVMDRFEHVPADGGDVGRRWSAATGLPLAASRAGEEVRVRFLTVNNRLDPMMHFAAVTAAMAGVRLDMIGKGWKHFTFLKRLSLMLSYAELENLTDADVIVATDADAVMSGEEAESFFAAFVASTAADEAEHLTYALRDIRFGKRMAPVLFSSEQSCFHIQTLEPGRCAPTYRKYHQLLMDYAESTNITVQPNQFDSNPFHYLNAGVMVIRVWALRRLAPAFTRFAKTHTPKRKMVVKGRWWCDQAVFGTLYLDLIWWELRSGAMDNSPVVLSAARWQESLFPPATPLPAGRAPHDLIGGLIGIDESVRLSVTLNPNHSPPRAFRIDSHTIGNVRRPEASLVAALAGGVSLGTSPVGVARSCHELVLTPRPNIDCYGVSSAPPECAYRDAVLGIPEGSREVVPLMWHYASPAKRKMYPHYRAFFSWYTPAMRDRARFRVLEWLMASMPPTRIFVIDPATNTGEYLGAARLLPHNASDDVSVSAMCMATVLK